MAGKKPVPRKEFDPKSVKVGIADPGIGRAARPVIKMTAQAAKPVAQAARPVLKTVASAVKSATAKTSGGGVGARKIVTQKRNVPRTVEVPSGTGTRTVTVPTRSSRGIFIEVPRGARLGPNVRVGPKPTSSGRTATTGRRPAPTQPAPAAQRQRPIIKMNPTKKAATQERPRLKTQIPDWMK
jgi:hypothetical protein